MKSHDSPGNSVDSAIRKVPETSPSGLEIQGPKVDRQDGES